MSPQNRLMAESKRMMKTMHILRVSLVLFCGGGTLAAGIIAVRNIPLSRVPKKVLAAAEKAVPEIKITQAEIQKTTEGFMYEFDGYAEGKKYEINVTPRAKVTAIRRDLEPEEDPPAEKDESEEKPRVESEPKAETGDRSGALAKRKESKP